MKKILLLVILSVSSIFSSCRKEDNPLLPDIVRVPVPLLSLATNSSTIIEDNDKKGTFKSTLLVNLYFPNDIKPKKYDVVVAKQGDYKNIKTYQADLTAIPGTVEVTTQKLASLFGMSTDALVPGVFFEVRAQFTLDNGTVIPAFSPTGDTYSSDLVNLPDANLTLKYQVVCALDINTFTGTLTVDDPDFWGASYPVTVTYADGKLNVKGWIEEPTAILSMNVDLVSRSLTIPKQITYAPDLFGYTNWTSEGKGEIDACTNTITINVSNSVDQGSFGAASITLKK